MTGLPKQKTVLFIFYLFRTISQMYQFPIKILSHHLTLWRALPHIRYMMSFSSFRFVAVQELTHFWSRLFCVYCVSQVIFLKRHFGRCLIFLVPSPIPTTVFGSVLAEGCGNRVRKGWFEWADCSGKWNLL